MTMQTINALSGIAQFYPAGTPEGDLIPELIKDVLAGKPRKVTQAQAQKVMETVGEDSQLGRLIVRADPSLSGSGPAPQS